VIDKLNRRSFFACLSGGCAGAAWLSAGPRREKVLTIEEARASLRGDPLPETARREKVVFTGGVLTLKRDMHLAPESVIRNTLIYGDYTLHPSPDNVIEDNLFLSAGIWHVSPKPGGVLTMSATDSWEWTGEGKVTILPEQFRGCEVAKSNMFLGSARRLQNRRWNAALRAARPAAA
jgi:hypothetical protein